jgi:DNA-3-methyladenine glycosylase
MAVNKRMAKTRANVLAYLKAKQKGEGSERGLGYEELLAATVPVKVNFFDEPTEALARKLLGCVLLHGRCAGTIVETEAYLGSGDLAAHSARGLTSRTRAIYGPPGRAYVYFIYGMYECLNVVAEPEGQAGCVLIRALEPVSGLAEMRERRHWSGRVEGLANGPGKLTRALAITREQYGARLEEGPLSIRRWGQQAAFEIDAGPRIGIRECVEWPLRFTWRGHPCLSRRS